MFSYGVRLERKYYFDLVLDAQKMWSFQKVQGVESQASTMGRVLSVYIWGTANQGVADVDETSWER